MDPPGLARMRPRYHVWPYEGGFGVFRKAEGEQAVMVSYRIRREDAERLKRQLNGELEKLNGGPTEPGLSSAEQG